MEVKEPADRFKDVCKSILDFITEYAKEDMDTRNQWRKRFELDKDISCYIELSNVIVTSYDFMMTIIIKGLEHVNVQENFVSLKYRNKNLSYGRYPIQGDQPLYDKLLIELFKDTTIDIDPQTNIRFCELLVDTNKYIRISKLYFMRYIGQKTLIDYCIANNYPIYTNQLTLIIDHVEMDLMFNVLPHFKGLVGLKCILRFYYEIDMQELMDDAMDDIPIDEEKCQENKQLRNLHIVRTCKEAEEKLISMLSINIQECIVSSEIGEYQGENIADRIKHKFYLASIYLPFKNHPLMDARLIQYNAEFM